jgi:signal transduction histidine kinase
MPSLPTGMRPGTALRGAAVAVLAFAALAGALVWSGYESSVDHVVDEAGLSARGAAADVDRYIQSRWTTLEAIATAPSIRSGDLAAMQTYFDALGEVGFDAGISWIDRHGWMRVRNGGYDGPPLDFSEREHVREALATGQPTVSAVFIGSINDAPIIAFTLPVRGDDGALNGLIGGGIRLDALSIGADDLRHAGGTSVVILDRTGHFISGPRPVETVISADHRFPYLDMAEAEAGAARSVVGPDGSPDQLVGYATAPSAGWLVLVQRPMEAAIGGAGMALAVQWLGIVLGGAIAAVILLWAARRLDDAADAEAATLVRLQDAVATLEQREALREAFVGVMSHELRTPVTTIYGATKLLQRSPRRAELESLLVDIEEEAERLQRITDDLLVLSRAERGLIEIRPEPVLLQRIVPAVISDISRRFPDATMTSDISRALPPVSAESEPLRQVLDNLLTNAVKYGGGSEVVVRVREEDAHVRVEVTDGGPGVPPPQRELVFDLFYRAEVTARRASGTGIGLFVVRQLVEAMGGTVGIVGPDGPGTTFVVLLRAYDAEAEDAPSGHGARAGALEAAP